MATFDSTLVTTATTQPGTLNHRGEVSTAGPYTPNNGSHHPALRLIHVDSIPSNYASVSISRRKFKELMETPFRDPNDLEIHIRNRQWRIRIGQMGQNARDQMNQNKELEMTWTQLKTLLGKRVLGIDVPLTDTYFLIHDSDL